MFLHRHLLVVRLSAFVITVGTLANLILDAHAQAVKLDPCEVPGAGPNVKDKARCGTYEVFEDRAAKTGRKIKLSIVVYPATGANKAADPLFSCFVSASVGRAVVVRCTVISSIPRTLIVTSASTSRWPTFVNAASSLSRKPT